MLPHGHREPDPSAQEGDRSSPLNLGREATEPKKAHRDRDARQTREDREQEYACVVS